MKEEELPEFLYEDDGEIKIGWHGDTIVTEEWNEFLKQYGDERESEGIERGKIIGEHGCESWIE